MLLWRDDLILPFYYYPSAWRLCCLWFYHRALTDRLLKGFQPMWIIKSQLVFCSDDLNKNHSHQIWETQLLLTDEWSWEERALPQPDCKMKGVSTHPWPHGRLAGLLFVLISCFTEHMCSSKISLIVNLCKLDLNFPFICVINVDIINPKEEVSKEGISKWI